jgi:hypothetical protein
MTGYTIENFEALYPYFELSQYRMTGQRRSSQRICVMYSNTPLADIRECLAFILCYLKNNPTQEMQADLFGIKQRQCCEFAHGLHTIPDIALGFAEAMPTRTNEELQEVLSTNKVKTNILFQTVRNAKIPVHRIKAENRKISSVRVLVKYVIGSTKRCRTVKDEYRLIKNDFVKFVFHTCAALHNFRIKINPFQHEFN